MEVGGSSPPTPTDQWQRLLRLLKLRRLLTELEPRFEQAVIGPYGSIIQWLGCRAYYTVMRVQILLDLPCGRYDQPHQCCGNEPQISLLELGGTCDLQGSSRRGLQTDS